jgi:hypothetical protein
MKTMIAWGMAALLALPVSAATPAVPAPDTPWPEAYLEIFKLAPGKQEAFIRDVARDDEVAAAAGLPPTQIFVHEDGADWDVVLLKPERPDPTPAQQAAMDAKHKALGITSGPAYFVHIREMIASHTDTKAYGPLSAAQWIAKLDAWRAAHPGSDEAGRP